MAPSSTVGELGLPEELLHPYAKHGRTVLSGFGAVVQRDDTPGGQAQAIGGQTVELPARRPQTAIQHPEQVGLLDVS